MDRLTKRHGKHAVQIGGETRRNDIGWLALADYEDLEEQGRLKTLPCTMGDHVYEIPSKVNYELNILNRMEENNRVYNHKIKEFIFTKRGWYATCGKYEGYGIGCILLGEEFGETWFLTEEEAEAKLKELEEHQFTDVNKMGKE